MDKKYNLVKMSKGKKYSARPKDFEPKKRIETITESSYEWADPEEDPAYQSC